MLQRFQNQMLDCKTVSDPKALVTTGTQWGSAERFISGSAPTVAQQGTSVDVQSVPSFIAASIDAKAGIPFTKEGIQYHRLTNLEVPVKG